MLEAPLYQDANTYPARLDRQFIEDVFDVEGVIRTANPGALLVTPRVAGANMSVDVAAGRAVIKGDDEANQGSYRVISTAAENLPIGAAPGSNSRIDLVIARVRDASVTGGVSSDWILEVIPGVVAAAPVAPAVPNTAIPLAQVLVAAGTVSIIAGMITDRRTSAGNNAYSPVGHSHSSGAFIGARVYRSAAFSVPNATFTIIPFDAESFDSATLHDNATNPSRVTVPSAGKYSVAAGVRFASAGSAGNYRTVRLYRNGVSVSTVWLAGNVVGVSVPFADTVSCAAGDYLELAAYQDSGVALGLSPFAESDVFFAVAYQGA